MAGPLRFRRGRLCTQSETRFGERERGDWAIIDGKTIYRLPGRRERGPSVCGTKRWEGQKPDQKWLNKTAGSGGAVGECLVLGPERLHNDPTNGVLALAEMTSSHRLTLISVQVSAVLGDTALVSRGYYAVPLPLPPRTTPPHHHPPTPTPALLPLRYTQYIPGLDAPPTPSAHPGPLVMCSMACATFQMLVYSVCTEVLF